MKQTNKKILNKTNLNKDINIDNADHQQQTPHQFIINFNNDNSDLDNSKQINNKQMSAQTRASCVENNKLPNKSSSKSKSKKEKQETEVEDRKITLNTTKIKTVKINQKACENRFNCYSYQLNGDDDDEQEQYKRIEKTTDYISHYKQISYVNSKKMKVIYILTNKEVRLPVSYYKEDFSELIKNNPYVILNLFLKAIPTLSPDSEFMALENLSYLAKAKNHKQTGVYEYIFYDYSVIKNNVLKVGVATYSDTEELMNFFNKKGNQQKLNSLKKKVKYYLIKDKSVFVKYKQFKSEKDAINKKGSFTISKYKGNDNKNLINALSIKNSSTNKMLAFDLLFKELEYIKDFIKIELDTVVGQFVPMNKDNILMPKKKVLKTKELSKLFKNKKIGVINLTEDKKVVDYVIDSVTKDKLVPNGKKKQNGEDSKDNISNKIIDDNFVKVDKKIAGLDHYFVLMHNKDYYKYNKSLTDPYENYKGLDTQVITIDNREEKTYKDIVRVSLLCLLIKENLAKRELKSFQEQNNTLIKIEMQMSKGNLIVDLFGVNIHENKMLLLNKEKVLPFIDKYKLHKYITYEDNSFSQEKKIIYILSYGGVKGDYLDYENTCVITSNDDIVIPDFKYIIANPEKVNRSMGEYGTKQKLAGVVGFFYSHKKGSKSINYYIGETCGGINQTIPRFSRYYHANFIKGNFDERFFEFFINHTYVRANNIPTVPFSDVYIREAIKYGLLEQTVISTENDVYTETEEIIYEEDNEYDLI